MYLITKLTIITFGISSFGSGIFYLMNPAQMLSSLDLPPEAMPSVRGNALAAIAMGIYYTLAAYQNNTAFFIATVPMRMLTASVFWVQGWQAASLWEGAGSVVTAMALWRDQGMERSKRE